MAIIKGTVKVSIPLRSDFNLSGEVLEFVNHKDVSIPLRSDFNSEEYKKAELLEIEFQSL